MHSSDLAAYTIEGHPVRSFQDGDTTWFCVNDLASVWLSEELALFPDVTLTFISKDRPTADPEIAGFQELLKVKFSN